MSHIAAINTYPISAPLKHRQHTAQDSRDDVTLLLVEVVTDDGIKGYGQVSSTPMKEIAAWIAKLTPHVIGMNALAHARRAASRRCLAVVMSARRVFPTRRRAPARSCRSRGT